ncbi:MAG: gamma-glutamyltransferase [Rhizomicrobium sp.]
MSGCARDLGFVRPIPEHHPIIVGDEPYAVKAAANVMGQGGNAADAVTALYFSLSVTYPVAAGLGGGGICLVHDQQSHRDEEFDFLASNAPGGGAFAIPGNLRGFAALHAAYGRLPWQRLIASSEQYASAGFPLSKALATRISKVENVVRLDASLAAEFMDESGHSRVAGSMTSNPELADVLADIRTGGPDALYKGHVAAAIASYSSAQSGRIVETDLSAYPVSRSEPHVTQFGQYRAYTPGEKMGAGAFAAALFSNLVRIPGATAEGGNTEVAVVTATKQALENFHVANLPGDFGSTGFAVVDGTGQSVACGITMTGPFGSGHTVPGTGITLAAAPSNEAGLAAAFLTPVIVTDGDGRMVLAGAGVGGPIGTASITDTLARLGKGETIKSQGRNEAGAALSDTVNAILCQNDICSALVDAGTNGLGAAPGG